MTKKIALVVIDLQNDFLPSEGSLAVPQGRDIIPKAINLLHLNKYKWATIIATQDWHPSKHCSFASTHNVQSFTQLKFEHPLGKKDSITGEIETQLQTVWPDHCVQNTNGSSIDPLFMAELNQISDTIPIRVVKKGYLQDREYYSCFKDTWKLHKTEMEDYLKNESITDVIFMGLAYDFCVLNSAIDCLNSGFKTYVLKLYCRSVYPDRVQETDNAFRDASVQIIDDTELLDLFQKND